MELRQLRYFVRIVELGSMSRAALDLDVVQSALSQPGRLGGCSYSGAGSITEMSVCTNVSGNRWPAK